MNRDYVPTFVFHPKEQHFPVDAGRYAENAIQSWQGHYISLLGAEPSPLSDQAPVYVHRTPGRDVWYLFFPYNKALFRNHEADWEHVSVYYEDDKEEAGKIRVTRVFMSQHGGGEFVHFHSLDAPTVYVSLGSHAFYETPGTKYRWFCLGNDSRRGDGTGWTPQRVIELKDDGSDPIVEHRHDWGQRGVSSISLRSDWLGPDVP